MDAETERLLRICKGRLADNRAELRNIKNGLKWLIAERLRDGLYVHPDDEFTAEQDGVDIYVDIIKRIFETGDRSNQKKPD